MSETVVCPVCGQKFSRKGLKIHQGMKGHAMTKFIKHWAARIWFRLHIVATLEEAEWMSQFDDEMRRIGQ